MCDQKAPSLFLLLKTERSTSRVCAVSLRSGEKWQILYACARYHKSTCKSRVHVVRAASRDIRIHEGYCLLLLHARDRAALHSFATGTFSELSDCASHFSLSRRSNAASGFEAYIILYKGMSNEDLKSVRKMKENSGLFWEDILIL